MMREFFNFLLSKGSELTLIRENVFLVFVSTAAAILLGVWLGGLLTRGKSLRDAVILTGIRVAS